MAVIETMTFALRPDADEEAFLAADRRLQVEFAYHQPGLLRRTTARDSAGGWIVIDLWRSADDADAMGECWDTAPAVVPIPGISLSLSGKRHTIAAQRDGRSPADE